MTSFRFAIPAFRLPAAIAAVGSRLPQWPHALPLVGALNLLLRAGILPATELAELEGRHFRIRVEDTGTVAHFAVRGGRFVPDWTPPADPDLRFSAPLSAYLQLMARQEDPDTLFFDRRLTIEGDTELGLRVKNMFDALDPGALQSALRARLPARFGGPAPQR